MRKLDFDDNWILKHKNEYKTWASMCREYNKTFGTEYTRSQFKWHCNMVLGLRLESYFYTEEHDEWLRQNYSSYLMCELVDRFNEHFRTEKNRNDVKEHCRYIGLRLSDEEKMRRYLIGQEYATSKKRMPIGSIGRPSNGYMLIKTKDGWEYLSKYLLRHKGIQVADGEQTVFLDGDRTNYDIDNLDVMPIRYAPVMMQNNFFSENPIITKCGIQWCRLHDLVNK